MEFRCAEPLVNESIRESLEVTSQKVTETVSHSVQKTKDVSREIGGSTPKASAVRKTMARGWPPSEA